MAGFTKAYVLGTPGGYMGADGVNAIGMLVLLGESDRQWLEPRYFDKSLASNSSLEVLVPSRPEDPDALLDALIAFAPTLFAECPSYGTVVEAMLGLRRLDFHLDGQPEGWSRLREEARPIAASLSLWSASFTPLTMEAE